MAAPRFLSRGEKMDIIKILNDAGFTTIEGMDLVLKAIKDIAEPPSTPLCSGYRVFPDGEKCPGCFDCGMKP